MKILVWLCVCVVTVLMASNVHAARGVVPSVAPLFPTPENTKPNVGRNVNFEGESVFSEPAAAELVDGQAPESAATDTKADGVAGATAQQTQTYWWWVLGILAGAGMLGAGRYWWFNIRTRV